MLLHSEFNAVNELHKDIWQELVFQFYGYGYTDSCAGDSGAGVYIREKQGVIAKHSRRTKIKKFVIFCLSMYKLLS